MKIVRKLVIISLLFAGIMFFFEYVEKTYLSNHVYSVYAVDNEIEYDVKKVMEATDVPMAVVSNDGTSVAIHLNDPGYEYLDLEPESIYTNTFGNEEHIFFPSKYPFTIYNIEVLQAETSSNDTQVYILSSPENINNDILKLTEMTDIEFSYGFRSFDFYNTIRCFVILSFLIIAEVIIYMFAREKLKTKIALLTLDGQKQKLNLFKITIARFFGLVTLIFLTIISSIYLHSILIPLITLIISILIYFICYIIIHIYEKKFWKNIDIYAIIKGRDIYSSKNTFAVLTYTVSKIVAIILIIILSFFILNLVTQIKAIPLWAETEDYYEMTEGFISDADHEEYLKFCYNIINDIEENNDAIYSYYYEGVVIVNANMIELQTDLEETYDLSKNYLIIPDERNKEETIQQFNEYISMLSPEELGNGGDYEVIHQDVEPLYSYDIATGYYPEYTVYYVLGSENTFEFLGVYTVQSEVFFKDVESVDYASYPFRDPDILEFSTMHKQAQYALILVGVTFSLLLGLFVVVFIASVSIRNNLLNAYLNNNRIYYVLKRLDGLKPQEVYKKEYRLNKRTLVLCMITVVIFLLLGVGIIDSLSAIIVVGIICLAYLFYENIAFKKQLIKLESNLILDVIKGKNE